MIEKVTHPVASGKRLKIYHCFIAKNEMIHTSRHWLYVMPASYFRYTKYINCLFNIKNGLTVQYKDIHSCILSRTSFNLSKKSRLSYWRMFIASYYRFSSLHDNGFFAINSLQSASRLSHVDIVCPAHGVRKTASTKIATSPKVIETTLPRCLLDKKTNVQKKNVKETVNKISQATLVAKLLVMYTFWTYVEKYFCT